MSIGTVAWAVQPGSDSYTRPRLLVDALARAGVIGDGWEALYHGTAPAQPGTRAAARMWPPRSLPDTGSSCVLSPVFLAARPRTEPVWIDLYDDWSIAPDIHPYYRLLAGRGYRQAAHLAEHGAAVTVNSRYMAGKIGVGFDHVVPNGVDESFAEIEQHGDDACRLVVLGKFFPGRTDFRLLREFAVDRNFDQVVVAGPGRGRDIDACLAEIRSSIGGKLVVHEWLSPPEIGRLCGSQTVALVPHLVSDYTLSQDLMKVYLLLAIGVRVICPRMLWPRHLPMDFALLLDHGVNPDDVLRDWLGTAGPTAEWRKNFAAENSWDSRARSVQARL